MSFDPHQLQIDEKAIDSLIKDAAKDKYVESLSIIFSSLLKHRTQFPALRFQNTPDIKEYVSRWVNTYIRASENRPSLRKGEPPTTFPDILVKKIYGKISGLGGDTLEQVAKGHAIMMVVESNVGNLLEEFLANELFKFGWHCCWGTTIKAADFCHKDGRLLQVKTSDNSENSSSKTVRDDTDIDHWYRRKSRQKEGYNWEELVKLTGNEELNEEKFKSFVDEVLKKNPECIYIEEPTEG